MKPRLFISIAVTVIALVVGVMFLRFAGDIFIREVTQEVSFDSEMTRERETSAIIGRKAPVFSLSDLEGEEVKLSDFLGKPVFIIFWTTWNSGAADEISILDQYDAANGEALFSVVAVNSQEDASVVSQFMRRGGYRVRVLVDETGAAGEAYGARNLPATYLLDSNGVIRDIRIGVAGKSELEAMFEKVVE